ncbi:MAG: DNA polymerase I [Erysipelotrichaceae bacterium]|nr:MAG: DNA polymerase [Erysipelotrichaceae bacterium]TXT18277.1 MAG: DNA polymerase I [Erysipelotrichaceae bacterium]
MKKMLLVDGNSMFFRAYYATAYTRLSANSQGVYTNAVFGFVSMLNKAVELVQPQALMVAFDSGKKTFRHDQFEEYKGTRKALPEELIMQFPIVREYCDAAHICHYQQDGLEADDIIGSLVKRYPDWDINVLSSDKDLLQLIDPTTSVWLMKKGLTEIKKMDEAALMEEMALKPHQICDLKGLMGDASDNIPGLPGVGEKTALKLLADYGSLENVLEHKDDLKGKLKENVETYAQQAIFSKWLATIKTDAHIELPLDKMVYQPETSQANPFFERYEMKSLLKVEKVKIEHLESGDRFEDLKQDQIFIFPHYRLDTQWPHPFFGLAFSDGSKSCFITSDNLPQEPNIIAYLISNESKRVYDAKAFLHACDAQKVHVEGSFIDPTILIYLDDSSINSYEKIQAKLTWPDYPKAVLNEDTINLSRLIAQKMAQDTPVLLEKIEMKSMKTLYDTIEEPLIRILYHMEKEGICVDEKVLNTIADETLAKLNDLSTQIYQAAGRSFNVNSPKQLAEVLFDELQLPSNKKQSTAIDVLEGLVDAHPIISLLIEYRKYQKLYSTYAQGLKKYILSDHKIHTVYSQTTAQTGRLSSYDPNLQNISVRDEESRLIRKAFIPSPGHVLFACDYSQIELRVLAHMADESAMIEAFRTKLDIHTKTAMDVFNVEADKVTSSMRRQAKAVNFGIIYGISDFGLAAQLGTDRKSAQKFIEAYLMSYPNIQRYMDETVFSVQRQGYVETLFKRRREIPEIFDKSYQIREFGKRAAMNAPIQGTAADIIKVAMINVDKALKANHYKTKMILQVHDELVFDVPRDELQAIRQLIQETMIHAVDLKVPMEVSEAYGDSWYEAK